MILVTKTSDQTRQYVCMVITYSKGKDQPGKGCQSCSWPAEHGKLIFPCLLQVGCSPLAYSRERCNNTELGRDTTFGSISTPVSW